MPPAPRDQEYDLDPPRARELRARLVEYLSEIGEIRTERVRDVMKLVPRHLFVTPAQSLDLAYANCALPIGCQQTISQPSVVAVMTEALELSGRERVLEIGTGSGYQAAILSMLAREVYSIELVPELAQSSAAALARLGYRNVHVRQGDGHRGWPEHAPFERIIVTAAAASLASAWIDQLAEGGILVAPVGSEWGQHLLRCCKRRGHMTEEDLGLVAFVPCRVEPRVTGLTRDAACVAFLQWALPRVGLEWSGFRRVRKIVCKRVLRRARELGLEGFDAYRERLQASPEERATFDGLCHIPVSRFYRDRAVFDGLRSEILPRLATRALTRGDGTLRAWSVGCASGEEPYTLSMLWRFDVARRFPSLALSILATDADERMLERARGGSYLGGSMKELPPEWRVAAFRDEDGMHRLRDDLREGVTFRLEDVRTTMPDGPFDLVLCRNLAFTYFEPSLQRAVAERLVSRLVEGGVLVVGSHETPPDLGGNLSPFPGVRGAYVRKESRGRVLGAPEQALRPGAAPSPAPSPGGAPTSLGVGG